MKFLRIALVAIVFLVNLAIAPPSWAGKDFTKGTDYAEVTQAINQLQQAKDAPDQAGYTPEEYQQTLGQLQQQKYIIETATKRAQCHNETTGMLAVYANKPKKSATQLYFLGAGEETDDDWDCDGFYLPAGTQVVLGPTAAAQALTEGIAVKFVDGTQSIARTNPAGAIELNVAPAKVFKAGEINWTIPTLSQADINAQTPSPQIID
ncbi:hypothetical protein H6F43_01675 [Leptolyngbya sp. FACHB-36]|uniref:hypothetical protein n=1 Tax=Leptolyngbya sp. FACHB-36 TaxID=2692808 RepID=UPI0016810CF8|nr:hypothetical protein [Leptolyngbya sp. FACHB-36]MBD2018894.1 hypothetical protein [Leptolyngbya sp. FACHB-36]